MVKGERGDLQRPEGEGGRSRATRQEGEGGRRRERASGAWAGGPIGNREESCERGGAIWCGQGRFF